MTRFPYSLSTVKYRMDTILEFVSFLSSTPVLEARSGIRIGSPYRQFGVALRHNARFRLPVPNTRIFRLVEIATLGVQAH